MIPCPDIPLGAWKVRSVFSGLVIWEKSGSKGNFRMLNIHCFKVTAVRVHWCRQSAGLGCTDLSSFLTPTSSLQVIFPLYV